MASPDRERNEFVLTYYHLNSGNHDCSYPCSPIKTFCDGNGMGCTWQIEFPKPRGVIEYEWGGNIPFSSYDGYLLVRSDLLELLPKKLIDKMFYINDVVFDQDVGKLKFYNLAAKNKSKITFRNRSNKRFVVCEKCKNPETWAFCDCYILRTDVVSRQSIYHNNRADLLVNSDIARSIRKAKIKKIDMEPIPVLEEPQDGLPEDLFSYAKVLLSDQANDK